LRIIPFLYILKKLMFHVLQLLIKKAKLTFIKPKYTKYTKKKKKKKFYKKKK